MGRLRSREALRRIGSATLDTYPIGKGALKSMEAVMTVVGRVAGLWRYPVKSMAAEYLDDAEVSWHGLAGDRRWAFIRDGQVRSGFPWLTIREQPELVRYRPRFTDPARPDASRTVVHTPSGREFDVADPALATEFGAGVRVIKQNRGVFDTMPLSLLSTQTLTSLGRLIGTDLAPDRFRPNLLVEAIRGDFPEDAWVGRILRIGGLRMRVDQRDKRCVMVTVDPVTLLRDPAILRAIARERDGQLGVYGSTVEPGRVAVGDPVELESSPDSVPGDLGSRACDLAGPHESPEYLSWCRNSTSSTCRPSGVRSRYWSVVQSRSAAR